MEQELNEQLVDWVRNRYFGKYRGCVVGNNDKTGRGRIKVRVPAVLGELEKWAMPCVPYAGEGVGLYSIPKEKSGVWVEFEAGDPSFPIWTGCFWADDERPKDERGKEATPPLKIIRSEKGLMVSLNDEKEVITVSDKDGSNIVTIEVNSGKITVKGALKVVVEAPNIELVENSKHPVVFGDNLINYLNQIWQLYQSHTHPGELVFSLFPVSPAPPVPPFPPATPALLSKRVTTG